MDQPNNRTRQERSPRFPSNSIAESLEHIGKIYKECGRAEIPAELAAKILGYSSLSGASRTTLASLSYYGLFVRQGHTHRVSDLALRAIRPLTEADKLEAIRQAFLNPPVFADLYENYRNSSENVLLSVLVHGGFTEEGARKAAAAFRESIDYFRGIDTVSPSFPSEQEESEEQENRPEPKTSEPHRQISIPPTNVLATYKIPLGSNEAELVFTGRVLEPEDFDALIDYVEIFKKQFLRKRAALPTEAADPPNPRDQTNP